MRAKLAILKHTISLCNVPKILKIDAHKMIASAACRRRDGHKIAYKERPQVGIGAVLRERRNPVTQTLLTAYRTRVTRIYS